jgi:hypothetical protein
MDVAALQLSAEWEEILSYIAEPTKPASYTDRLRSAFNPSVADVAEVPIPSGLQADLDSVRSQFYELPLIGHPVVVYPPLQGESAATPHKVAVAPSDDAPTKRS